MTEPEKAPLLKRELLPTPVLLMAPFGNDGLGGKPDCKVFVTFGVTCLGLTLMQFFHWSAYLPELTFIEEEFHTCFLYFWRHLTWMFLLPVLTIKLVFREDLTDHGLNTKALQGRVPLYLGLTAMVFGVIYVAAGYSELQETYPYYHRPSSWRMLLLWELLFGLSMVCEEFFFRGFALHGLKHKYGHGAIFVSTMAYFMIHMSKPMVEATASVLFGVALCILSLRTDSIAGGAWLHASIAISIDFATMIRRPDHNIGALPW